MGLRAACELLRVEGGVGDGPGQLSLKYAFMWGGGEGWKERNLRFQF